MIRGTEFNRTKLLEQKLKLKKFFIRRNGTKRKTEPLKFNLQFREEFSEKFFDI